MVLLNYLPVLSFSAGLSERGKAWEKEQESIGGGRRWGGREKERWKEDWGPEVCLGRRWLLDSCCQLAPFDAISLAQACLSHSMTAIKDVLRAVTSTGWGRGAGGIPHTFPPLHLANKSFPFFSVFQGGKKRGLSACWWMSWHSPALIAGSRLLTGSQKC